MVTAKTPAKQDFVAGDFVTYTTSSVIGTRRQDFTHEAVILKFPTFRTVMLLVQLSHGRTYKLVCSRKAITLPQYLQGYKGELLSSVATRRSRSA